MKIRDFYTAVAANEANTEEVRQHAQDELNKMDAANEKRRNTPSKTAVANGLLADELVTKLEKNIVYTSAQIGEMMGGIHSSKATALIRILEERGIMRETSEKVKSASGKGKVKGYLLIKD